MNTPKININKEIIALFSGQSSVVTTPKLYIQLTNSHSLALILNQCVYWSNKASSKDGWFYKEYEEWFEEVHVPERTLRRRFDRLEQLGWITTKVKKVKGINTKHIFTHTDRIIESISNMLLVEYPNRPECPNQTNEEQNPCAKVDPTGQTGRSEPANLADSTIYTDDYGQIKTTNCESSSSFFFSETLDQSILSQKLFRDERSDDEFMNQVVEHVDNKSDLKYSRIVRAQGVLKLLKKLKEQNMIFYVSGKEPKEQEKPKSKAIPAPFTQDELKLMQEALHAKKMAANGQDINIFIKPEKLAHAEELLLRAKAMESKPCQSPLPEKSARKNSLASASNLVSHLSLSPQGS